MDETLVRQHAERHGEAVVKGDMRTAGGDLTPEAQAQAPEVMKNIPRDLQRASVIRIKPDDGVYEVYISYEGSDTESIVLSTWEEKDGRPMITKLEMGG